MSRMQFPRRILVTGGCGYIGSALIPHLLKQPEVENVIVVDNLSRGRLESIGYLFEKYGDRLSFIRGDLRHKDQMSKALLFLGNVPETIVHLGATVDAATSVDEDKRILCEQVNELGTFQLAEIALELGVKTFVYHSSTSVYGHGHNVIFTEEGPEPNPLTPYGKTKLISEKILKYNSEKMRVIVLRPASVFGFAPGYRYEVAVNLLALYAHFGIPLTIYKTAENESRPYLALEDAIRILSMCLTDPEKFAGDIWNAVSFNATLGDIVQTINEIYPNVTKIYTEAAKINQISFIVSGEKLYRAGFEPRGNIKSALNDVKNYLDKLGEEFAKWERNEIVT